MAMEWITTKQQIFVVFELRTKHRNRDVPLVQISTCGESWCDIIISWECVYLSDESMTVNRFMFNKIMLISHLVLAWWHGVYPKKYADRFMLCFVVIALKSFVIILCYVNTIIYEMTDCHFPRHFSKWESSRFCAMSEYPSSRIALFKQVLHISIFAIFWACVLTTLNIF